jgi:hypothetical protein
MTIANLTASAWAIDPTWEAVVPEPEAIFFEWSVLAEVSVTDADGNPISGLPKSAWKVHVTDASGTTLQGAFTVKQIQVPPQAGFYLLTLAALPTESWVALTACGISVDFKKQDVRGQVVVPIQLMGKHAVQTLAPPSN